MDGKTCVITGATSGLGRAAALALGRIGYNLFLVGRNERAGRDLIAQIRGFSSASELEFLPADLSSFVSVRSLAAGLHLRTPSIKILINNAGARFHRYETSADGIERTFATNHLGHFLLTALLLDLLLGPTDARVISVASAVHAGVTVESGWLANRNDYDRKSAYARSKLANVLFSFELARRLEGTNVSSNAVDPGGVATRLGRNNGLIPWLRHIAYYASKGKLQSATGAAQAIVHLACAPELRGTTGKYFSGSTRTESSSLSLDPGVAARLWQLSVRLTKLDESIGSAWAYFKP